MLLIAIWQTQLVDDPALYGVQHNAQCVLARGISLRLHCEVWALWHYTWFFCQGIALHTTNASWETDGAIIQTLRVMSCIAIGYKLFIPCRALFLHRRYSRKKRSCVVVECIYACCCYTRHSASAKWSLQLQQPTAISRFVMCSFDGIV